MPPGDNRGRTDNPKFLPPLLVSMVVVCLLAGCASLGSQSAPARSMAASTLNNCYSLLHQLLEEQKDVSMLRFIKEEHADLKNLIRKIAAASGKGSKLLEKLAKEEPSIPLDEIDLPPGETATRDSIAASKKKQLLGQSGKQFELTLLLTQAEALSYAWHLAEVAGQNDPQPDRAHALANLSQEMKILYQEVCLMLVMREK